MSKGPSYPIIPKAGDMLLALDVRCDYSFERRWNEQIQRSFKEGAPGDIRLALLGAIRAVFVIFLPGPTGAANAKHWDDANRCSGTFVGNDELKFLQGWYRLVVDKGTASLHEEGEEKSTGALIWSGKGEQSGLDGNWRVFFQGGGPTDVI